MYYNGIDNSPMLLLLLYDSQWKLSVFASWVQGDARAKWDPETVEKFDEKSLLNLILFPQTALSFQFAFSFSSVRSCFILKKRKVQTFWFGFRRTMRKEFSFQSNFKIAEIWACRELNNMQFRFTSGENRDCVKTWCSGGERKARAPWKTLTIYFHGNMFKEGRAENVEHAHLNTTFLTLLLCSIVRDCREDFSC